MPEALLVRNRNYSYFLQPVLLRTSVMALLYWLAHTGDIVIRMRGIRMDKAEPLGLATNHAGVELEQLIGEETGQLFRFGRQIKHGELAEFSARRY